MLTSDNTVLAVLSRAVASKFAAVGNSLWHQNVVIFGNQNEIVNLDNICKVSDFVDFMCFIFFWFNCIVYVYFYYFLLLLLCAYEWMNERTNERTNE